MSAAQGPYTLDPAAGPMPVAGPGPATGPRCLRAVRVPGWSLSADERRQLGLGPGDTPPRIDLWLDTAGHFSRLEAHDPRRADTATDTPLPGAVLLPPLVEAHAHLDKAYTVHRAPPTGPGLLAAIEATQADSARWSADDLARRARRALHEAWASGCGLLRTHLNWNGPERPLAWDVIGEAARDWAPALRVERVNISPLTLFDDAATAASIARQVAASPGGVLGAFVHSHQRSPQALRRLFRLAAEHGLRIDLHADEELAPQADGVALAAALTQEFGLHGRVACSHACALAVQDAETAARTLDAVAAAGLTLITLPTTNLLLQDAQTGRTPRLRGLTLVQEARARGIAVAVGSDNVQDAFCPQGRHDPLAAFGLAVLVGQLPSPLDDASRIACDAAALGAGVPWSGWTGAPADALLLAPAWAPAREMSDDGTPTADPGLAFPSDRGARRRLQAGAWVAETDGPR